MSFKIKPVDPTEFMDTPTRIKTTTLDAVPRSQKQVDTSHLDIGFALRFVRIGREMSQADLEKKSGVLRTYISRIECGHGKVTVAMAKRLAGCMNFPMSKLCQIAQAHLAADLR